VLSSRAGLRVALLCLCLGLVGCGAFREKSPTLEGRIAFTREDDNDGYDYLYVIDASGGNESRLDPEPASGVSWSPSGKRVAYSSGGEIVVTTADAVKTVWRVRVGCYSPVWSPRGDLIACEYSEPYDITTINTRTRAMKRLTPDCCYGPAWSPDGRQIAYLAAGTYFGENGYAGPAGLFVMDADGSDKHRITGRGNPGSNVAWSPRGNTIAFVADNDIWAIDATGGNLRRVFNGQGRPTEDMTWSPEGRQLAFAHGDGQDFEVFLINADGTGLRNLTDNDRFQDREPSWSPDGKALAFSTNRDGNYEIYVMNANGGNPTRVTDTSVEERSPVWSPAAVT
jgi:TolB protein